MKSWLYFFRVIGVKGFAHIETYSKKLEHKEVERRLLDYINNIKSDRVFNLTTQPRVGTLSSLKRRQAYSHHC